MWKFRFADSVTVARNGQIYFTDASSEHSMHSWHLDVLEARPHGRMLNFDFVTGRTTVLMQGLGFANGIALSPQEDFLVVCESWKYAALHLNHPSNAPLDRLFSKKKVYSCAAIPAHSIPSLCPQVQMRALLA